MAGVADRPLMLPSRLLGPRADTMAQPVRVAALLWITQGTA